VADSLMQWQAEHPDVPCRNMLHQTVRTTVPDLDRARFCKKCRAYVATSLFMPGQRRYLYRKHYIATRKTRWQTQDKGEAARLWNQGYADAKRIFGHHGVHLSREDIRALLIHAPSHRVTLRVLPVDPRRPLSKDNSALLLCGEYIQTKLARALNTIRSTIPQGALRWRRASRHFWPLKLERSHAASLASSVDNQRSD